ncbi:hypothetical protein CAPTEDRAFT_221484 [Capitella teleta]|uniref:Neurotransmitter-gated ion-channel ligand-binding domain-containing protein n=1 Tax=Capitella teleta TaxID=283909 RepID=R7UKN8_CAPTE|nr:hypothetical protein CAPTEDRAFT_221484 [Capitella teleta]|eukprot:ELU04363.1 hypothetical protein CAPTEDRAFT_221484 [Capitella teleta]
MARRANMQTVVVLAMFLLGASLGDPDSRRLYDDLLEKGYSKLARPVRNSSHPVRVSFGLRFTQLIDVDEKNEIMTTNMWAVQEWTDSNLVWTPAEYGGLDVLYVPADHIWLPDVVLSNSADGQYDMADKTPAIVTYEGRVRWTPPAIFRSICNMDVEFFPFDEQVDMQHIWHKTPNDTHTLDEERIDVGIDMQMFIPSQEWDVLAVPAQRNTKTYPCCAEPYPDVTFNITLRRKTLFYTFNIILPCVCINMLTLTCFYVPCDCHEKISICITILLSLSMFQLLLLDLVPGTSMKTPLLGKYILFTLIILCGSIFCSVISLNVHYRGNKVGVMGKFTKWFFLEMLAKVLCIRLPSPAAHDEYMHNHWVPPWRHSADISRPSLTKLCRKGSKIKTAMRRYTAEQVDEQYPGFSISPAFLEAAEKCAECDRLIEHPTTYKAMDGITFIATHHIDAYFAKHMKNDWICMAMVVDRFLLWIYLTLTLVCTLVILLSAPSLFDTRQGFGVN